MSRGVDLQENHRLVLDLAINELENNLRFKIVQQPILEFLITDFGRARIKGSAHNFVVAAPHAPDHVSVRQPRDRRRVRQG